MTFHRMRFSPKKLERERHKRETENTKNHKISFVLSVLLEMNKRGIKTLHRRFYDDKKSGLKFKRLKR